MQRVRVPTGARNSKIGDRLRQLRVAAGLTQSELARDRFSKEYISQIERGKTRPTAETVEWLAVTLGVDPSFLASGVSGDERARAEAVLARAEALVETGEYDAGDRRVRACARSGRRGRRRRAAGPRCSPARPGRASRRARCAPGSSCSTAPAGSPRAPPSPTSTAAEVLFRLGVGRYLISSIATAIALFGEALALVERSALPSDALRVNILTWRSRCYRRQRDYEAAREDVERALELAEAMEDPRALGEAYFQASIVAERDGHWVLARTYAERAKSQYEELADRMNVGRLLNNLGGLEFLLGEARAGRRPAAGGVRGRDRARRRRRGGDGGLVARPGVPEDRRSVARRGARRHALRRLGGREDRLDEIGNARLVLGRALLEQERLDEADAALRGGRGRLRPALLGLASGGGVGRAGRPGPAPRRRPAGRRRSTGARPRRCRTSASS